MLSRFKSRALLTSPGLLFLSALDTLLIPSALPFRALTLAKLSLALLAPAFPWLTIIINDFRVAEPFFKLWGYFSFEAEGGFFDLFEDWFCCVFSTKNRKDSPEGLWGFLFVPILIVPNLANVRLARCFPRFSASNTAGLLSLFVISNSFIHQENKKPAEAGYYFRRLPHICLPPWLCSVGGSFRALLMLYNFISKPLHNSTGILKNIYLNLLRNTTPLITHRRHQMGLLAPISRAFG